ncbi:hypothetical protein DRQ53_13770 [bacterium]|nr:MAG: hypothetical protein DRQ53_13770 [bacterium]
MAENNPTWGYSHIQGALRHLDHRVARSTVAKIMKEHGIEPAPDRPTSWRTFVRSRAEFMSQARRRTPPRTGCSSRRDSRRSWNALVSRFC